MPQTCQQSLLHSPPLPWQAGVEGPKSFPSLHTGVSRFMSYRMDNRSHLPPSFNIYRGSQLGFSHNDAAPIIYTEAAQWSGTAMGQCEKAVIMDLMQE